MTASNFASKNRPTGAAYIRGTCKTIVLWGKNGSGKTTTAVNLACALAEKNNVVGIISSNLYFGELQIHLNCHIFEDKGLHKALSDNTVNLNEQFIKSGVHSNIFLLTLPNRYDALGNTEITTEQAKRLLNQATIYFDYLLIDGSAELQNPLTFLAMEQAKSVLAVYKPSISACLWHNGMEYVREQLHIQDKILPVLNGYDRSCEIESFVRHTGLYRKEALTPEAAFPEGEITDRYFKHELPFVQSAAVCENSGSPIYYQTDKQSRRYVKAMDRLANAITERE